MLERGHIEIYGSGRSDFAESEKILSELFAGIDRGKGGEICSLCAKPSALKPQPRYVTEYFPMQQAITRMYFKAPDMDDRFANVLLGMILGGMTTSRFFENIREKQSLCYYCSSVHTDSARSCWYTLVSNRRTQSVPKLPYLRK